MTVKRLFSTGTRRRRARQPHSTPPSQPAPGAPSPDPSPTRRPRRYLTPGAANGIYANEKDAVTAQAAAPRRPRAPPLQGPASCPEVETDSPSVPGQQGRSGGAWGAGGHSVPGLRSVWSPPSVCFLPPLDVCLPVPSHLSPSLETSLPTTIRELLFPLSIKPRCFDSRVPRSVLSTGGGAHRLRRWGLRLEVRGQRAHFWLRIRIVHLEEEAV